MEKYLIIIELDNVILKNHKEITEESTNILKKVASAGHKIVFTSSRPYGTIMKKQHMSLPFPSIVVANGGRSAHDSDGSTILNYLSNYKYFQEALDAGIPLLKSAIWAIGDELYVYKFDENLEPVVENFAGNVVRLDDIPENFELEEAPSTAFCVPQDGKVFEFFKKIDEIDGLVSGVYDSDKSIIEVQQDGVTKKSTVEMILSASGIDEDRVIVFVASEKDLEMAKDAGYVYVMKNSPEYVKEMFKGAKVTEATCNEDGVAKELTKFFSIKL